MRDDRIEIELRDARYVNGKAFPAGTRVFVAPRTAFHLVILESVARFVDESDRAVARQAEVEAIKRATAGPHSLRFEAPQSPWRPK